MGFPNSGDLFARPLARWSAFVPSRPPAVDKRLKKSLALDGAAIEPPCRMTERRHGDCEADEERYRSDDKRRCDDCSPQRDSGRIFSRKPQRRSDGWKEPDVALKHQRERDHAQTKRQHRKTEADRSADGDEQPATTGRH